jgi:hypothetical protein
METNNINPEVQYKPKQQKTYVVNTYQKISGIISNSKQQKRGKHVSRNSGIIPSSKQQERT